MVTVLELIGLVIGPLKNRAVHRSGRAVVSPALDLDPVASLPITHHGANLEERHPAGQYGWVTVLGTPQTGGGRDAGGTIPAWAR